jgi:hypothetical protein
MIDFSVATRLLGYKRAAAAQAEILRSCLTNGCDTETLHKHLRGYILAKYILDEEDCPTDDIAELTEISLAKSQKIDRRLLEDVDRATGCTSATSAMRKKVLLYIAMERELEIKIPDQEGAIAATIKDLALLIQQSKNCQASE